MALAPITIGSVTLDPVLVLLALACLAVIALIALAITLIVHMKGRRRDTAAQATELAELKGRLQSFAEISVARQGDVARAVNERLDRMTHRVGSDLNETSRKTHESIAKLNERLAVIDTAQKNLTDLSTNMVSLQEILANKQARGAFGQMRMETIVKDGLPKGAYSFQPTLSNGKRPDCLLHMPNTSAGVVIDAKFPLEGFEAFRTARRDEEKKDAARRVRVDVGRHVDAMAERYFIAGETQDTAILFVPSEAIYADLAEHFSDLVQKAHRARIVICAPNMLMLAVQTMQAILKDVKMREQAHLIQREVAVLMEDMGRFRERVLDLQRHFGQANGDIEKILTSSEKIAARGHRIENLEFEEPAPCRGRASQRRCVLPLATDLFPEGEWRATAARGRGQAERRRARDPPARPARQRAMTDASTALARHRARADAGRRRGEPRQPHHPRRAARRRGMGRSRLGGERQFRPGLPAIHRRHRRDRHVADGGTFRRGDGVGDHLRPGRHRARQSRAHLSRFRQLHDARLCRPGRAGAMAATQADDGAERHHADRLVDGGDHRDLASRRPVGAFLGAAVRLLAARFFAACSPFSP